jgi:hypothetical protein
MPDPQRDIAPIIEPLAPPMPPAGPDYTFAVVLGLAALLLAGWLYWYWRRRAPLRALRKLSQASDPIAGADALAALVASRHVTPPAFWQEELELLRFGPPAEDAEAVLARLCQGAESMLRAR